MATQIKLRRDSYQNWYDNNPVLAEGEPCFDITNKKLKIGDGTTAWRLLPYFEPEKIYKGVHEVSIDTLGNIKYPGDITQSRKDNTTCTTGTDTVIYTSTGQYQHAIKLFVMVEGSQGSQWETQACDIIAVRGYVNNVVHVTAYGVTYSGANPLATFDGQWNATSNRIEITCRPAGVNNVVASVHAIEMTSND